MMVGVRARGDAGPAGLRSPEARLPIRGADFVLALEETSRSIRDPVAKLRYIRESLARYQQADRCLQAVPWAPLRRALYRVLSLESLRHLLTSNPLGAPLPVTAEAQRSLRATAVAVASFVLLLGGGLAALGYQLSRAAVAAPAAPAAAPPRLPVAESLPALPAGVAPASVWLVEKGEGWEQYSNGLRIDTSFTVEGEPRRYRLFEAERGMESEVRDRPAGILFHTSESDIWPLDEAHNENLRASSHQLLRYLQRNHVYHYLIDRFGRVFRVVSEETKANHAGKAIWTSGTRVYLNLNSAFLGICFETRWEGGRALPITQAQLAAGRSLTDYLRKRWEIPPDMCVAHGLASVNSQKHLIGHHLDWARGFPFEAFGLPNQYLRPAPSVAVFGFQYDEPFLSVMGEPWPGVREAERILAAEAAAQGKTVDGIRRERQALYDRWLSEQTRDQEASTANRADRAPTRAPRTSSGG